MKLIFLHGMPGVGKLTVARELARITGYKLFHNHLTVDLVSSVFEFGSPSFVELREKIWLDVFSKAAEEGIPGLIFTFAFERTVSTGFIKKVVDDMEARGAEILFVRLFCTPEELEKRLTDSSRAQYGKLASLELFRKLIQAGVFLDPEETDNRLTLNTTSLTAVETAQRIATELELPRAPDIPG